MREHLVRPDARTLAAGIGTLRIAFGLAALLAPRSVPKPLLKAGVSSPDAVTAWRMAGGRDVVLGVGALAAAVRGSPALSGWLRAGALADTIDLGALAADDALRPLARAATAVVAAGGAAAGLAVADRTSS